jgi:hypothetical protein
LPACFKDDVKVLYVAPEHVSGGLELFAEGHRRHCNQARWVSFFPNVFGFPEDICFNLWGMPSAKWVALLKRQVKVGDQLPVNSDADKIFRSPPNRLESFLFAVRDLINTRRIRRTIWQHNLNEFDIYHFEEGVDPFRDGRWVRALAEKGKGIVCFYHGSDLRNRGVLENVHRYSKLNLTSEIDLLGSLPGMQYLYLPIDTNRIRPAPRSPDGRIRISHAARNRANKGSDAIEHIVLGLARKYPIDWVMIENRTHTEALAMKAASDIFIDQISDSGGWGYGASSVESLAMGVPTVTRINPQVADFLGEHPFMSACEETLEKVLLELIEDENCRLELGAMGRIWVEQRHGLDSVMRVLYEYYSNAGLI